MVRSRVAHAQNGKDLRGQARPVSLSLEVYGLVWIHLSECELFGVSQPHSQTVQATIRDRYKHSGAW